MKHQKYLEREQKMNELEELENIKLEMKRVETQLEMKRQLKYQKYLEREQAKFNLEELKIDEHQKYLEKQNVGK